MRPVRGRRLAAWFLGFTVLFSPYLIPGSESSPRLTDLVGMGLWALLAAALLLGRALDVRTLGRLLPLLVLALLWVMRDALRVGTNPSAAQVRWLLVPAYGYVLWHLARAPETRRALVLGMFWGAAANLGVVALQRFGFTDLTIALGLASPRFEARWALVGGVVEVRPFGMWGHPNASSGVIAIGFPLVLGLIDEGRLRAGWMAAGLALVFGGSALTLTRSGMVVGGLLFVVWALGGAPTPRQRRARLGLVGAMVAAAAVVGPPGGWQRWLDPGTSTNQSERTHATAAAFELAVSHPAGLGDAFQAALIERTGGIPATHNAWLHFALTAGLPLTALVLAVVAGHAVTLAGRRTVEGWLALGMAGLFFFEEYFRASAFIILAGWLAATPTGLLAWRRRAEPAPSPAPDLPIPATTWR